MCQFKSGIILKDRVFIADYESHGKMLKELGISDTQQNAERLFVRAELSPQCGDVFSPIDTWIYRVDQDILPDWYVEECDVKRMIDAVKAWAEKHIYIGVDNLRLTTGKGYYLKNCTNVTLLGNAEVVRMNNSHVDTMYGSSQVGTMREGSRVGTMWENSYVGEMRGSSHVGEMYGSSHVGVMYGSSHVGVMYGSSHVGEMYGSSHVGEMYGSSHVGVMFESSRVGMMRENSQVGTMCGFSRVGEMYGSSMATISEYLSYGVKPESVVLYDNATIKDNRTKTIYLSGNWKSVIVGKKD